MFLNCDVFYFFQVLLLEHDVPHGPFSEAVYACLPDVPWSAPDESHRKDLRSLTICSVDPPGCTDIDDALHCRQIASDRYEVFFHVTVLLRLLSSFFLL